MSTEDSVRESAAAGRIVLWEEAARDGAQAKTLMTAPQRVRLARDHGAMFGADGPRHVVFAAGFPAVCADEFDAVRRVAIEAEGCVSVAAVCRAADEDVDQALAAVRGSARSRIMIVIPASDAMAGSMVHGGARDALAAGVGLVSRARDRRTGVAVDVCFADASRADHTLMAEYAARTTEAGAGVIILADTVGGQLPTECTAMYQRVQAGAGAHVVLGSHLHNDLGLGLTNTMQAVATGVRVIAGSWLGLAERTGLVATEQLLFLLARHPEEFLGPDARPWWTPPDLTRLPGLAQQVSAATGVPLTVTTPIVGSGVGTISTGTPFVQPGLFQPFDPKEVLGIEPRVLLTHLASARVVNAVAGRLGYRLAREQTRAAMAWVKARAYRAGAAVIDDEAFAGYLDGLTVSTHAEPTAMSSPGTEADPGTQPGASRQADGIVR